MAVFYDLRFFLLVFIKSWLGLVGLELGYYACVAWFLFKVSAGAMSFALAMAASRNKSDEELYNTSQFDRFYRNAETGQLILGVAIKRPKFPVTVEVLNVACVACDLERSLEYWRTISGYQVSRIKCGCGFIVEVVRT